jgi:hypothetical protein
MVRPLIAKLAILVFALAALPAFAANSVTVTQAAALGPSSSQWGLQVNLVDAAPRNATYVMAGPAQGFNNETSLNGSFFINPQSLTVSTVLGQHYFQMIDFLDSVQPGGKVQLIFHLTRSPGNGDWFINVYHWNQNAGGGAGGFQFSGNGFFALDNSPFFSNNRIDFAWNAGNPGHLTMWRTVYTNGVPDPSGTIQMFSVNLPGQQTAVINYVFAGLFTGHLPGTFGTLYLDDFTFNR